MNIPTKANLIELTVFMWFCPGCQFKNEEKVIKKPEQINCKVCHKTWEVTGVEKKK